ncbi:Remorin [Morella rubra]|uniref:Remorin n=1 Tax=Morella rubra TaxID=262757 RepID=A0A6A1WIK0_9ROSI|nr:Remorin [Morella rubra]
MGEEETQRADQEPAAEKAQERSGKEEEARNDVAEEKGVIPPLDQKPAPPVEEKVADPAVEKSSGGLVDREAMLASVATEKRLALIKAWEEKARKQKQRTTLQLSRRAYKRQTSVGSWENSNRAAVEAQLKKIEEDFDKKKAEYAEKMKNKLAEIHKVAEEKRAIVEATRREEFLKVEETATKYRDAGFVPKKFLGCFSF